ncbi:MAG: DNA alkylation repair protein, partial [SAR324 cluster bacterium]|nr:DNA alkylation repair protein [SAR324 cluster bacterium]
VLWLKENSDPAVLAGKNRFGIVGVSYGIIVPVLRAKAKTLGKNLKFAQELWGLDVNEAKLLASFSLPAAEVTVELAQEFALGFNSWEVVDQFCNVLVKGNTALSWLLVDLWKGREEEYIKRAAFSLIAMLAVHDKKSANQDFLNYFPLIKIESTDERNFVKKAVNWALRQIGKRNATLLPHALALAKELKQSKAKSARWIGQNAAQEFLTPKIIQQVQRKDESNDS